MATRRSTGTRPEVVRCPYCGEDYSVTYKRCPFCDGKPAPESSFEDDPPAEGRRSGGKRLVSNTRGGGYGGGGWGPLRIVGTVVSLGLIVAAVWIVVSVVSPLVNRGSSLNSDQPSSPPVTSSSAAPTGSPDSSASPAPTGGVEPTRSPEPSGTIPASQTATSFTLNRKDFTLSQAGDVWNLGPAFLPAGSTGTLTWSSSKPEVATVSDSGIVTAVAPGVATITATMAGGYTQECIVRCTWTGASSGGSGSAAATLTPSHSDVTLYKAGESFRFRVSGTDSTPVWSTSNSGVASVDGSGTVTAVSKGTCNVTATVDGQTFTCIVRCNF
ncbi:MULTISPECIES: Ig-like domain-containing protein [Intestinimonas]|uniref:Ig-like domain-containing protein n=1 Tax=Intestinimonas TaxID=1392389 RepID=UPI00067EDA2E|nr:Ig-like domain-containing protein [Intestinimonas massiliensis (ex Afouda et al. 2020)]